ELCATTGGPSPPFMSSKRRRTMTNRTGATSCLPPCMLSSSSTNCRNIGRASRQLILYGRKPDRHHRRASPPNARAERRLSALTLSPLAPHVVDLARRDRARAIAPAIADIG